MSEIRAGAFSRHPWEIARARAILDVLRTHRSRFDRVLDYGCGDGFTGLEVQREFAARSLVGVDIHLSDEACGTKSSEAGEIRFERDEAALADARFDLILLCDVIEHVEDDREFVSGLVTRRLDAGAMALVTVPAFQSLFSAHDRALRHYRRYTLAMLRDVLRVSGLEIVEAGYLFASLLVPRGASKLVELVRAPRSNGDHGVGGWSGSEKLSRFVAAALTFENTILLRARRLGMTLPGLTAWALCKKP